MVVAVVDGIAEEVACCDLVEVDESDGPQVVSGTRVEVVDDDVAFSSNHHIGLVCVNTLS